MPRYEYPGYGPVGDGWLTKRPGTKGGYHGGTDNPAKPDTPVYAEYAGKVFRSGVIAGYGRAVVVESVAPDGTKFYALYGHLGPGDLPAPNTPIVAGRPIPGAVIGTKDYVQSMGGLSTGPHLHREIISGNVRLNADGPFGIYSSDVKHKAAPDTFDINQPLFPYERPSQPSPPQPSDEVSKRLPGRGRIMSPPIAPSVSSPIVPGMPIPGAEGPTFVGGPNGPEPVVPPPLPRPSPKDPRRHGVLGPLDLVSRPSPDAALFPRPTVDSQVDPGALGYLAMLFSSPEMENEKRVMSLLEGPSRPSGLTNLPSDVSSEQTYPVRRLISRVVRW
ncbi:M23 family metallopeptidase [Bradyrhizobium aeschynomenes]|uniref:M23 family metallopeptidase n=1 Tax=Bradyrhizobium aeschynomenes TaxID=2734909 RepID=UPI001554176F|nr:M23 family metallopeptidase [Bradyrhizobium aeschynomenes]